MLQNLKQLYGRKLGAADGYIGHVKDFYFDDQSWAVRYLIADTGSWLAKRLVLFTPHAFGFRPFGVSPGEPDVLRVSLNRNKIEDSPFIEAGSEPTREDEEAYYDYYGLQVYWRPANVKGEAAFPTHLAPAPGSVAPGGPEPMHLHRTKAMAGYKVCATDGAVGCVRDLLVDDKTWLLTEIVIATGPWYASKKIVIRPASIGRIGHAERTVFVNLAKKDIQQTMRNDVAQVGAGYR